MAYYQQPQYKNNNNNSCFICYQQFDNDDTSPTWEKWVDLKDDEQRRAHPDCFRCDICKQKITGKYNEATKNRFICLNEKTNCIRKEYGDNTKLVSYSDKQKDPNSKYVDERYCFICQQKLDGSYMADSDNNKYHKQCFKCTNCSKPLGNEQGFVRDNTNLYCKPCRIEMKTKEQQRINNQNNYGNPNFNNNNKANKSPFGVNPNSNNY